MRLSLAVAAALICAPALPGAVLAQAPSPRVQGAGQTGRHGASHRPPGPAGSVPAPAAAAPAAPADPVVAHRQWARAAPE